jgi:hypothetical protein
MDTPISAPPAAAIASDEARAARKRWEAEKIARAQAEIDAGFGITGPELDQFFHDLLHSDQPVTVPPARRLNHRD